MLSSRFARRKQSETKQRTRLNISGRKDAFFEEFFGKKAKNHAEIPAEQRLKKSSLLNLGNFYIYSTKKD
jgi:hypothetical protein